MSEVIWGLTRSEWIAVSGIVVTIIVGVIGIWWNSKKGKKKDKLSKPKKKNQKGLEHTKGKHEDIKHREKSKWKVIYNKQLIVPSGEHKSLKFELNKNDVVKGIISEKDDYDFEFYIMNESEYYNYKNDENFNSIEVFYDKPTIHIYLTVPNDDIWYFVFDAYSKHYNREININLRKKSAN